jgi:hypothetical protein
VGACRHNATTTQKTHSQPSTQSVATQHATQRRCRSLVKNKAHMFAEGQLHNTARLVAEHQHKVLSPPPAPLTLFRSSTLVSQLHR